MEYFVLVFGLGLSYMLVRAAIKDLSKPRAAEKVQPEPKLSNYQYDRKKYIMTYSESELFRRLDTIFGMKYHVFPQVHLSSLLNHEVRNGQDWRAALSKIQRKSVDFVLVDKNTLVTACAIELDDRSHDIEWSRVNRDELVNEIFEDSGVPLVRFRFVKSLSDEDIRNKIVACIEAPSQGPAQENAAS